MAPRSADGSVKTALVEAAARLVSQEGLSALTTRRVAAEVGTSTMALYTHFSGMDQLRREVRKEGFARLGSHLTSVEATADPVADLAALGWAYCVNALSNPHLYRAMFGEPPVDEEDAQTGWETFEPLLRSVQRCMEEQRFSRTDPRTLAMQIWTMTHGMVSVHLTGLLPIDELIRLLTEMAVNLFTAFGDERKATMLSIDRARQRMSYRPE